MRNWPDAAARPSRIGLELLFLRLGCCSAHLLLRSWPVTVSAWMAHSNVKECVRQLKDAIAPDVQPGFLCGAELWDVHLPPRKAAGFFYNVRVDVGEFIVPGVAQRPAGAVNCMIAALGEFNAALVSIHLLIAAGAEWPRGWQSKAPSGRLCPLPICQVNPPATQGSHETNASRGPAGAEYANALSSREACKKRSMARLSKRPEQSARQVPVRRCWSKLLLRTLRHLVSQMPQ